MAPTRTGSPRVLDHHGPRCKGVVARGWRPAAARHRPTAAGTPHHGRRGHPQRGPDKLLPADRQYPPPPSRRGGAAHPSTDRPPPRRPVTAAAAKPRRRHAGRAAGGRSATSAPARPLPAGRPTGRGSERRAGGWCGGAREGGAAARGADALEPPAPRRLLSSPRGPLTWRGRAGRDPRGARARAPRQCQIAAAGGVVVTVTARDYRSLFLIQKRYQERGTRHQGAVTLPTRRGQ